MMDDTYLLARQYLSEHNVLCLATTRDDLPWVAPVFYGVFNAKLIFLSAPHTLHCKNISANSAVAGSIQEDYNNWTTIKGIQLQGTVSRVTSECTHAVIDSYSKKFPVTGDHAPVEIANALEKIHWFELSVEKLLFIDNSKGLGHRVELDPERFFSL